MSLVQSPLNMPDTAMGLIVCQGLAGTQGYKDTGIHFCSSQSTKPLPWDNLSTGQRGLRGCLHKEMEESSFKAAVLTSNTTLLQSPEHRKDRGGGRRSPTCKWGEEPAKKLNFENRIARTDE